MKLIVGLGNPGRAYERTRHNAGFWVVEAAARAWDWSFDHALKREGTAIARYAQGSIQSATGASATVRLLEPLTYMNASGQVIGPFVRRQGIAPSDVLVVLDDVHLPSGRLRLRASGSSGGHHGLASIMDALGTEEIPRLRVGVGEESLPEDLAAYVLAKVRGETWEQLHAILPHAVATCHRWIVAGVHAAMNVCNRTTVIVR